MATLLEAWSIYVLALYRQVGSLTAPVNPIAPVTMISGVVAFLVIAYLARRNGFWVALGSAIVGTLAAPMIFELPFDLIVMGRTYPPAPEIPYTLLFFLPLFLVEISSFALLTLSPVVKLSRATLFLLAGMFVIFAVWALFGFAYPAAPIPVALNMISKVLAFATAVSLFLPPEKSAWFARQFIPARKELLPVDQHPLTQPVSSLRGTEEYQAAPQTISRRTLIIGLATAGVAIAGGGFIGLVYRYPRLTYRGHTNWVYDVAWSPDDKRIASTSVDTTVQVWNAADGGDVSIYGGHADVVITPAWSPDGKRIASSSSDSTVQVWSPA